MFNIPYYFRKSFLSGMIIFCNDTHVFPKHMYMHGDNVRDVRS